jgi:hypothetical protein
MWSCTCSSTVIAHLCLKILLPLLLLPAYSVFAPTALLQLALCRAAHALPHSLLASYCFLLFLNFLAAPAVCLPCHTLHCCSWYYVELHMPFRNDYGSTYRGVAIRMMGELASNNCTSTRQVPTHVEGGQLKYLLNQPDPSGDTLGSKFVDTLRGVTVILERWTNTSAIVRIIA